MGIGDWGLGIGDWALVVGNRVEGAGADAAAAALADILVDTRLVVLVSDGVGATFLCAAAAAPAKVLVDRHLARRMLFHLSGAAAAAHADILDGAAEARHFMALEVGETDHDVGVHQRAPDFRLFHILTVLYRHLDFVGAAQAVGDDDLAARGDGVEAVQVRAVHVLQRVLAAARVQRVAVRQERHAPLFLDEIGHRLRVIRPQEREVSQLAEMHLDRDEFSFHVDVLKPGGKAELFQLVCHAGADLRAEVGKEYLCFLHENPPNFHFFLQYYTIYMPLTVNLFLSATGSQASGRRRSLSAVLCRRSLPARGR